jgi:hypothetical protein
MNQGDGQRTVISPRHCKGLQWMKSRQFQICVTHVKEEQCKDTATTSATKLIFTSPGLANVLSVENIVRVL